MWAGVTDGNTAQIADDFNSSIRFDCRMYRQDIKGSIAHARMLGKCNIIPLEDSEKIIADCHLNIQALRKYKTAITQMLFVAVTRYGILILQTE